MKDTDISTTRKLLVILDGMDDERLDELGGQTPRERAFMPGLTQMTENGSVGMVETVPAGNEPATDVALLKILGCQVPPEFKGRAWLETMGEGIEIGDDDLCIRCNLIRTQNGKIISHSAGNIPNPQKIVEALNSEFGDDRIRFYSGKGYRNLLIVKNCHARFKNNPVHELIGKSTDSLHVECDDTDIRDHLDRIVDRAPAILSKLEAGDANAVALWAFGGRPELTPRKIKGTVIAGVSLVKGIGKWMGMDTPSIAGATGGTDTDLDAKFAATAEALKSDGFVLLHIEAPDEASHLRDVNLKIKILEDIDRKIISPLLNLPYNIDITLQADHATSSLSGNHLVRPVTVIKYNLRNES